MKAPAPFFAFLLLLVQKASSQSVSGTQEVYSKSLPDFEAASSPCGIEDVSGKTYFFQVFLLCLSVDISVNGEVKLYENSVVSCTTTGTNGKAYTTISTAASVGSDGSLNFEGNYDGKVSFAEDKSLDKVESNLKLIDPQNLLFDIQLSLPSCNSPSSVPSSAPSNLASASPSSVPSLVPSYRPSSVPTSIPSRYPPCDVSEVTGKTYYLTLLGTCLELELAVAGTISIYSNQGNTCPPTSLTKTIISRYDGDNSNENVINFTAEGPNGLPGSVTFRQDLVDEVTSIVSLQAGNVFNIEVVLPSCDSPSASPTIFTSNVPTSVPSAEPSLSFEPSEKPSQTPSIVLSNPPSELASVSPSSVPTMLPSILPTRVPECIIEEVSGKTYYFKMITICFKVEMFPGGKMSTLIVGFNDPCEANTSGLETEISAYDASQSTDMMAVYSGSGANDWNGEFLFRQDTISALQISTTKFDTQTQEFSFTMTLPSCDAPSAAPSFVPVSSSIPSSSPSDKPSSSNYPSLLPTLMPISSPSRTPSYKPSSNPSASSIPSSFPSSFPSSAPTIIPTCLASDTFGKTFYATYGNPNSCFKWEMFNGGHMYYKDDPNSCDASTTFDGIFSTADSFIDDKAIFSKGVTWSGTLSIRESSTVTEVVLYDMLFDYLRLTWTGVLILPSCTYN